MTEDFRRRYERDAGDSEAFRVPVVFCSRVWVQTVAPEAEAAAEGIDGAENNIEDKRPDATRFHLFVYHVSRTVLNKVPLEICRVSRDVTVPLPGGRVSSSRCWRKNWDRISLPSSSSLQQQQQHDLNVSAACVRLVPQSFGKWNVWRSQLSSTHNTREPEPRRNHLLPQSTGIFFFSFFFFTAVKKKP